MDLTQGVTCALAIAAMETSIACGASPSSPSPAPSETKVAAIAIAGLTATVEPLTTTPAPGLLYRLTYGVRETAGRVGATLTTQHFTLSDGRTADGDFNATTPHVAPATTITVQSTLSIYPATTPAAHVTFSISYTDDGGRAGTATAEADIARIGALAGTP